jgi:hypothetical protein
MLLFKTLVNAQETFFPVRSNYDEFSPITLVMGHFRDMRHDAGAAQGAFLDNVSLPLKGKRSQGIGEFSGIGLGFMGSRFIVLRNCRKLTLTA